MWPGRKDCLGICHWLTVLCVVSPLLDSLSAKVPMSATRRAVVPAARDKTVTYAPFQSIGYQGYFLAGRTCTIAGTIPAGHLPGVQTPSPTAHIFDVHPDFSIPSTFCMSPSAPPPTPPFTPLSGLFTGSSTQLPETPGTLEMSRTSSPVRELSERLELLARDDTLVLRAVSLSRLLQECVAQINRTRAARTVWQY